MVINIVTPKYGACSLTLNFSEKLSTYTISVSYKGEKSHALETAENELSATLVRGNTKELKHEYAEGINTVTITL